MDMKLLNDFIAIDDSILKITEGMNDALDELKSRKNILHDELLDEFEKEGVGELINDVGRKVKKSRRTSTSPTINRENVCEILRKNKLESFLTENYDTKQLNAYFNEALKEEKELPKDLAECIKTYEFYTVKVSRPKKKSA